VRRNLDDPENAIIGAFAVAAQQMPSFVLLQTLGTSTRKEENKLYLFISLQQCVSLVLSLISYSLDA
ncbi:hypothetical protein RYX36_020875, partial [Vicia faba]